MREAFFDKGWIRTNSVSNEIAGICLGYDRCAEHEWGIKPMNDALGINPNDKNGVSTFLIKQFNDNQLYFKTGKKRITRNKKTYSIPYACLIFDAHGAAQDRHKEDAPFGCDLEFIAADMLDDRQGIQGIMSRFDESAFQVTVFGKTNVDRLKDIHAAFLAKDLCIKMSGSATPFGGNGLCLVIASRIDEETRVFTYAKHQREKRLEAFVKKHAVEKKLKQAGVKLSSLMPKWTDASETDVSFFVNPIDPKHQFGWFSLADVLALAEGRGPILKEDSK